MYVCIYVKKKKKKKTTCSSNITLKKMQANM